MSPNDRYPAILYPAKVSNAILEEKTIRRPSNSLVERLNLLDLVVTAHKDARFVMNVLGYNLQHPLHFAVHGLATG